VSQARSDQVQLELLRAAGPERRIALAEDLSATVMAMAWRAVEQSFPELDDIGRRAKFIEVNHGRVLAGAFERYLRAPR
jgi:hypothetical protein